jgi:hypothetical protein
MALKISSWEKISYRDIRYAPSEVGVQRFPIKKGGGGGSHNFALYPEWFMDEGK